MLTKPQFSDLEAFWVMTLSESVQPRGKCSNLYNQWNLVEKQFSQFTIICQSLCWNNQNHLQLVTRAIRYFFSFRDCFYTSEERILSTSGLQRLRLSRCIKWWDFFLWFTRLRCAYLKESIGAMKFCCGKTIAGLELTGRASLLFRYISFSQ